MGNLVHKLQKTNLKVYASMFASYYMIYLKNGKHNDKINISH